MYGWMDVSMHLCLYIYTYGYINERYLKNDLGKLINTDKSKITSYRM